MAASSTQDRAPLPTALEIAPTLQYLKSAAVSSPSTALHVPGGGQDQRNTQAQVAKLLNDIEQGREDTVLAFAREFDHWEKPSVEVSAADIDSAIRTLSESEKQDIKFQFEQVRAFALAQRNSVKDFQNELYPGVTTGQKVVPIQCAGCYVPGGRFSHVSSAIMSVATAKAAGVRTVIACSPPFSNTNMIHPATLYALHIAGADKILCLGGIQAVATLAFGLFTGIEADILVGPGNKWVAEAKRNLFGRVGIDMVAGPTEILILADDSADALIVETDLLSQAEHGVTSPVWLITTCATLGKQVVAIMEDLLDDLQRRLPDTASRQSWRDYGEVVLVNTREEMARLSDLYAAEHLEVRMDGRYCNTSTWCYRMQSFEQHMDGILGSQELSLIVELPMMTPRGQVLWPQSYSPHQTRRSIHWWTVGGQVPKEVDMAADDT
eukprot:m.1115560 g.1115560  ORF g.1115560 m.1115560 type:complete len:438 (+) comp24370_c0_seq30:85-1398(+)